MSDLKWLNDKNIKYQDVKFLISVYEALNEKGFDVIAKGSSWLHFLQEVNESPDYFRGTKDIDLNIAECDDEEEAIFKISKVIEDLDSVITIKKVKKLDNGYKILLDTKSDVDHIDIKFSSNDGCNMTVELNQVSIKGSMIEKIIADKMTTITGRSIRRRTKDIFDIYLILKNYKYNINYLLSILDKTEIGNMELFLNKKDIVLHMGNQKGIIGFPECEKVYDFVLERIIFILNEHKGGDKIWGLERYLQ